jgi:hypothetical protein
MMIEVLDTVAARQALARRRLPCPDCGQPGRARERTVREPGGAVAAVRPDRARCTGCGVTHVVLDAGQLRIAGIRAVVALGPEALPARARPDELGDALDALGAAAMAVGDRFGLQGSSLWARVTVLTRGRLLAPSPAG